MQAGSSWGGLKQADEKKAGEGKKVNPTDGGRRTKRMMVRNGEVWKEASGGAGPWRKMVKTVA